MRATASTLFCRLCAVVILVTGPALRAADTRAGLKTLTGHVPAVLRQLTPKGTLAETNQLHLAIGLPLRDTRGLDAFLAQVYDPASPLYRHYLSVAEFTEKFGPTKDDYASVTDFARRNNLTVTATHLNRLVLDVSGAVADIQKALHVTLRTYAHPTEARDFYAPDTEPTIDASLPIAEISGLNNYARPHPNYVRRRDANVANDALPKNGSGTGGTYLGNDFRAAYVPGVSETGNGQMVGLLEFDGYYPSDISAYEKAAGYAPVPLKTVLLDGYNGTPTTGENSGNPEVSLDIEMAIALAPNLTNIVVFEAGPNGDQNDMITAMAESNAIKQLSCSWGWAGGPSATIDNIFKEMQAQGQSFFTAAGDSDAFTVGANSVNGVDNTSLDNAPASSTNITVVGATTLTTTGPGGAWESETVWNWGVQYYSGQYVGSSGGVSSYYDIPTWQTGISMTGNAGSTKFRNIPDVAMVGDNIYVAYGDGAYDSFGGTSCAAPLWAALTALMNEQAAAMGLQPLGFINPLVYALGKGSSYGLAFHDITTGNDFSGSSPSEYRAVTGYDLASGWGTPIGKGVINALVGPPDPLSIAVGVTLTANGAAGGPFSPALQSIVLTNSGSNTLNWAVTTPSWLNLAPTNGSMAAHSSASVEVTFTDAASDFEAGVYSTNIVFEDEKSKVTQPASLTLEIGQSIVQNGGFETGDFTGWTLVGATTAGHGRGGVTVYDAVEGTNSGYHVVHSGSYGAFLGDNAVATLTQTLTTGAGQSYLLSLWVDNAQSGSGEIFVVNWNGAALTSMTNPPVFDWTNMQFIVSATGGSSVLQFAAENEPDYFGLDDVTVTPIPTLPFRAATLGTKGLSLNFITSAGLAYQLQYETNLSQPNWINLGMRTVASGSTLTITDTNALSGPMQRFYRLAVSP
jgi:hypothetical protein